MEAAPGFEPGITVLQSMPHGLTRAATVSPNLQWRA